MRAAGVRALDVGRPDVVLASDVRTLDVPIRQPLFIAIYAAPACSRSAERPRQFRSVARCTAALRVRGCGSWYAVPVPSRSRTVQVRYFLIPFSS